MDEAVMYEFDGRMYENVGEFLDALSHEYRVGDQQLVLDALDEYGFDLSDIDIQKE